jgi:hypothetical protein
MFTFQNGTGTPNDLNGGHHNNLFRVAPNPTADSPSSSIAPGQQEIIGIQMNHNSVRNIVALDAEPTPGMVPQTASDPLSFAIATEQNVGSDQVSYCTMFDTTKSGAEVWDSFAANGTLVGSPIERNAKSASNLSVKGTAIGGAIARKYVTPTHTHTHTIACSGV